MQLYITIITTAYCLLVIWLIWHWHRIEHTDSDFSISKDFEKLFFSIIIPVRNEAPNIAQLLNDLSQQQGCFANQISDYFEVIVVDDHSTDGTADLVTSQISKVPFTLKLTRLRISKNFEGSFKKKAIAQGVSHSAQTTSKHIIITTDGDCRLNPKWLDTYYNFFARKKPKLVSGPVTFYQEKSLFDKLQAIEFSSLIGTGAACMQAGSPNMCNGANLAFTKEVFLELNGYEGNLHVPSGDDEFLLQKVFKRYPNKIYFLKNSNAIVYSRAQKNLSDFYQQRKRWAGKWKYHKSWKTSLLAIFIFGFHFSWLTGLFLTIGFDYPIQVFVLQSCVKVIVEFFFLLTIMRFLKKPLSFFYFLLLQVMYPFYTVFFGIAANFGMYNWKGRKF